MICIEKLKSRIRRGIAVDQQCVFWVQDVGNGGLCFRDLSSLTQANPQHTLYVYIHIL